MDNGWNDILKQKTAEAAPLLPEGDFAAFSARYASVRRRAAIRRWSISAASAFAVVLLLLFFWPKGEGSIPVDVVPGSAGHAFIAGALHEEEPEAATQQNSAPSASDLSHWEFPTPKSGPSTSGSPASEPSSRESSVPEPSTPESSTPESSMSEPSTFRQTKQELAIQPIREIEVLQSRQFPQVKVGMFGNLFASAVKTDKFTSDVQLADYGSERLNAVPMMAQGLFDQAPAEPGNTPVSYRHSPIPLEAGLSLRVFFFREMALNTGLKYTQFASDCIMPDDSVQKQRLHYIGIPLGLDYVMTFWNGISIYAGVGVLTEKMVYGRRGTENLREKGVQFAMTADMGLQYDFNPYVGLYLEPDFCYYLTESSFETFRSRSRMSMGLKFGLRLTLR